ncbi:hypothetical protein [Rathayibacter sp. Leaf296]|uniref:hypothetical protein n=1 Tax=Rathayibacter sp. Leaf296 TaxID=1736327 RepID=UPI000702C50F|nr:hypothetical protein [Rathayibacter sp. Leaf296]KQQ07597.1 hypothetical protein ASF46_18350 [Rathayibacter sp. Leaf296]
MTVLFTQESAQDVANIVAACRNHLSEYWPLRTVLYEDGRERAQPVLHVREVRATKTLANGIEIVYCTSESGRLVEILFPRPGEREFGPAEVLIEGVP